MELEEEPSLIRKFLRVFQEPFSGIKERWMHYFTHLAADEVSSASSTDVRGQSDRRPIQEERERDHAEDSGSGQKRWESSAQSQFFSGESSVRPFSHQDTEESQEGNLWEAVPKKELIDEPEVDNHRVIEKRTERAMENQGDIESKVPPAGRPKMMYKITVTAIGGTIGLSHLWRLPNMAHKMNSGNFIIIYSALLLIFGFPLYFTSLASGQYSSKAALKVFRRVPFMQGVGLSMVLVTCMTTVYQMQMIGFGVHYFVSSFHFDLPWTKCSQSENGTFGSLCFKPLNEFYSSEVSVECPTGKITVSWNSLCIENSQIQRHEFFEKCCGKEGSSKNKSVLYSCREEIHRKYCLKLVPPAVHYWNTSMVRPFSPKDPPDGVLGEINLKLLLCSLAANLLVYGIILMGFERIFFISMIVTPLMFAALILLVASTIPMPGSLQGLLKFVKPDLNLLSDPNIWYAAVEQSLYSLGLGMGLVISIGSISPFNNASHKTALAVTLSVLAANLLSACLVYSVSGVASYAWNRPFDTVLDAGLGTAFVAYSQALSQLPLPWLFSCIFFALFTMTGACSLSGLMSTISVNIFERAKISGRDSYIVSFIVVFSCFLLGIPLIMRGGLVFIEALDTVAVAFSIPVIVVGEIIATFTYGIYVFGEDIAFMLGFHPSRCIFSVFFTFPLCVIIVLSFKIFEYKIPEWSIWTQATGFGSLGLILAPIVLAFLFLLILPSRRSFREVSSVGPRAEQHKLEREEFHWKKTKVEPKV